ncbi:MAG: hypothetical protein ACPGED_10675, partial [Flavobacteriales bacterium]
EPIDTEMNAEVQTLEEADLSMNSRTSLVNKLMFNTAPLPGDSSYNAAYFNKLYENLKARLLEGASEGTLDFYYGLYYQQALADSINGNFTSYEINKAEAEKILDVQVSKYQLRAESIEIDEALRRMVYNAVYDEINMNSFNFINATYDDLFFRFPTDSEFNSAYEVVEFNQPNIVMGELANNKIEYVNIIINNSEFDEGMIIWAYESLLARSPTSNEVFDLIPNFQETNDFQRVQRLIMISDEYAGFD